MSNWWQNLSFKMLVLLLALAMLPLLGLGLLAIKVSDDALSAKAEQANREVASFPWSIWRTG